MEQTSKKKNIGLLILRIILGGLFIFAGAAKLSDMTATLTMFNGLGIPVILTYLISYGEVLGGIALLFGVLVEVVTFLLAIIMVGAVYFSFPMGIAEALMPLVIFVLLILLNRKGSGSYRIGKK